MWATTLKSAPRCFEAPARPIYPAGKDENETARMLDAGATGLCPSTAFGTVEVRTAGSAHSERYGPNSGSGSGATDGSRPPANDPTDLDDDIPFRDSSPRRAIARHASRPSSGKGGGAWKTKATRLGHYFRTGGLRPRFRQYSNQCWRVIRRRSSHRPPGVIDRYRQPLIDNVMLQYGTAR